MPARRRPCERTKGISGETKSGQIEAKGSAPCPASKCPSRPFAPVQRAAAVPARRKHVSISQDEIPAAESNQVNEREAHWKTSMLTRRGHVRTKYNRQRSAASPRTASDLTSENCADLLLYTSTPTKHKDPQSSKSERAVSRDCRKAKERGNKRRPRPRPGRLTYSGCARAVNSAVRTSDATLRPLAGVARAGRLPPSARPPDRVFRRDWLDRAVAHAQDDEHGSHW